MKSLPDPDEYIDIYVSEISAATWYYGEDIEFYYSADNSAQDWYYEKYEEDCITGDDFSYFIYTWSTYGHMTWDGFGILLKGNGYDWTRLFSYQSVCVGISYIYSCDFLVTNGAHGYDQDNIYMSYTVAPPDYTVTAHIGF
jgi:hypothetical protein